LPSAICYHHHPMLSLSLPQAGPISEREFFTHRRVAEGLVPCPRLGIGAAWLGDAEDGPRLDEAIATLHAAWSAGFLLTDTSPRYGNSEVVIGNALGSYESCDRWNGPAPILATKCGAERQAKQPDFSPDGLRQRLDRSRKRFNGRSIDLLAVHEPHMCPTAQRAGVISFIESVVDHGEVAVAGLGGGGPDVQKRWLEFGSFSYVITHARINALTLQGLTDSAPNARQNGAKVLAATPLMMGFLGSRFDASQQQLRDGTLRDGLRVFALRAQRQKALADEAGIPATQLAVRFLLSLPTVDLVLCGPSTPAEWEDNQAAYEAGPLPEGLYGQVWRNAQDGDEPRIGG